MLIFDDYDFCDGCLNTIVGIAGEFIEGTNFGVNYNHRSGQQNSGDKKYCDEKDSIKVILDIQKESGFLMQEADMDESDINAEKRTRYQTDSFEKFQYLVKC